MLYTNAETLKFSEQFQVIRNTIFHTKHMKFLLSKISYKYVKLPTWGSSSCISQGKVISVNWLLCYRFFLHNR